MALAHQKFQVAAVQAAPAFLDLDASVEQAIRLIDEAAAKGARLIAFPETWIPGYPWWIWLGAPAWAIMKGFVSAYFDSSLAYGSAAADKLRQAAKRNNIVVVLGLSERDGGSLYIAQWIIGPDGETVAQRRKLKPTHVERSVFGEGDGSDLAVHELEIGRVGGGLCDRNHAQIDIRIDQPFLIRRQPVADRHAVRSKYGREPSAGMKQIMLVWRIAQQLDHLF